MSLDCMDCRASLAVTGTGSRSVCGIGPDAGGSQRQPVHGKEHQRRYRHCEERQRRGNPGNTAVPSPRALVPACGQPSGHLPRVLADAGEFRCEIDAVKEEHGCSRARRCRQGLGNHCPTHSKIRAVPQPPGPQKAAGCLEYLPRPLSHYLYCLCIVLCIH